MRRDSMMIGAVVISLLAVAARSTVAHGEEKKVTKYVRFQAGRQVAYGIVEGDGVRQISGSVFGKWQPTETIYPLAEVKLLVPTTPSKVLAVGANYRSHLGDRPAPKVPEIFIKLPSALVANEGNIVIPPGATEVHYEGELVIVMAKRAKNVSTGEALDYVLGVTCGNDVSERVWQKGDLQWWRAKASDTFAPCGPYVVSGINYDNLQLELRLNGKVMQKQRTSDLIHDTAAIVSWVSRHVTLEPGDLIYTGTPGKTSAIKPGDVVEVEIEGIGVLRNHVVTAPTAN